MSEYCFNVEKEINVTMRFRRTQYFVSKYEQMQSGSSPFRIWIPVLIWHFYTFSLTSKIYHWLSDFYKNPVIINGCKVMENLWSEGLIWYFIKDLSCSFYRTYLCCIYCKTLIKGWSIITSLYRHSNLQRLTFLMCW